MASVVEAATIIPQLILAIETAEGFIGSYTADAINAVKPVMTILFTLYIIIWGWAVARGMVQELVADAAMRFLKIACIYAVIMNWGDYSGYVIEFVVNTPDAIAQSITGLDSTSTIALTEVFSFALKIGSDFVIDAEAFTAGGNGVPDLSLLAIGIGVWGGGAALAGVIVGTLVIARIMLAVLMALGPIFFILILFESTKKMFDAWLGHVLGYMIVIAATIIATPIVVAIMTEAIAKYVGDMGFNWLMPGGEFEFTVGAGIGLILTYGICGVAMQKIIMAADALGRGISVTTYVGRK